MSAHSPEPWRICPYDKTSPVVLDATGHQITVLPVWTLEFQGERDANARLIAAAPELLQALKLAAESISLLCEVTGRQADADQLLPGITAAIAKATGEQS